MAGSPMISVRDLRKSHGPTPVLQGLSFAVAAGELVSVIGPSGCGKTTMLRCLNCLETPDAGSLAIAGVTLERAPGAALNADFEARAHDLRQRVGMVFQNFNLFAHKTALENVMLAQVVVQGRPPAAARETAVKFLAKVGLGDEFHERYPSQLSGGQQQRAAIARALALNPQVMLYDEPTSALDPEMIDEVLAVMRQLDAEGMTQIVVTHEMRFARDASDFVLYMEKGEIVENTPAAEIFQNPRDERTRRFLKRFL
ncbi:MAG TPA: amino acid ABC transporter ATP-binding protein [Opitutales bacterium]|nr:amino acid ABC transporter ATP-binding protein [Opitutales bacterium]